MPMVTPCRVAPFGMTSPPLRVARLGAGGRGRLFMEVGLHAGGYRALGHEQFLDFTASLLSLARLKPGICGCLGVRRGLRSCQLLLALGILRSAGELHLG